jgi:hypothetical protein
VLIRLHPITATAVTLAGQWELPPLAGHVGDAAGVALVGLQFCSQANGAVQPRVECRRREL